MTKTIKRTLVVDGTFWNGACGSYLYTLKEGQNPTNLADAKAIAGDFQDIDGARVLEDTITTATKTTSLS